MLAWPVSIRGGHLGPLFEVSNQFQQREAIDAQVISQAQTRIGAVAWCAFGGFGDCGPYRLLRCELVSHGGYQPHWDVTIGRRWV